MEFRRVWNRIERIFGALDQHRFMWYSLFSHEVIAHAMQLGGPEQLYPRRTKAEMKEYKRDMKALRSIDKKEQKKIRKRENAVALAAWKMDNTPIHELHSRGRKRRKT